MVNVLTENTLTILYIAIQVIVISHYEDDIVETKMELHSSVIATISSGCNRIYVISFFAIITNCVANVPPVP